MTGYRRVWPRMSRKVIAGVTPDGVTEVFVIEGHRAIGFGVYKVRRFTGRVPATVGDGASFYDLDGARLIAQAAPYPSMDEAVAAAEEELTFTARSRAGIDALGDNADGSPPMFTWTVVFDPGASFRVTAVDEDQALVVARHHVDSPTLFKRDVQVKRGWEPWP